MASARFPLTPALSRRERAGVRGNAMTEYGKTKNRFTSPRDFQAILIFRIANLSGVNNNGRR